MAVNKVVINQDGVENVLIDITDSTVTPNDMPEGVVAYDKSGEKITGSMEHLYGSNAYMGSVPQEQVIDGVKEIKLTYPVTKRKYLNAFDFVTLYSPLNNFGTATAQDVVAGKTFTSEEGLTVTGTMPPGLDTSDATATADDIVVNRTAYVDGELVTGKLPYMGGIVAENVKFGYGQIDGETYIDMWANSPERGLVEVGDYLTLRAPMTDFGDVKSTDVMRGKTYTSSEGIRLYGTGGEMNPTLECNRPPWSNGGESVGSVNAIVNNENGLILPKTALITVTFPLESLGNATPEDVLAGKVFSSADGIKCVGTFEPGPGEIEVTDDGNGNLTILNAVVTDNNGAITVTM